MRLPSGGLAAGVFLLVASAFAMLPAVSVAAKDVRTRQIAEFTTTLDALLAIERKGGGWTFSCKAGTRREPCTRPLKLAERIAAPLGIARWDIVVVRSPGTPAAGLALLGGHRLTGRKEYLEAAKRSGDLLIAIQMGSGGWFSEMPVEEGKLAPWFALTMRRTNIDDDVTTGGIRFLLALWEATGERRYRSAAERGLALLAQAQLPSGAWPSMWRPAWKRALWETFEDLATVNDGTTPQAVATLAEAGRRLERADFVAAARRGAEWLVRVRRPLPQAGWAQQYDASGRPAPARRFEPAALASWESRHVIDALLAFVVATGETSYCEPIPDAVAWLVRSAIAPGCWARFYELETNAPLYFDAAAERVAEPDKARPSYDWTGDFGIPALLARLGLEGEGSTAGEGPGARGRRVSGARSGGARLGASRGDGSPAGVARAPVWRVAGDPGACAGETPHHFDVRAAGDDARVLIAHAASLLTALEPLAATPCERSAQWRKKLRRALTAGHKAQTNQP